MLFWLSQKRINPVIMDIHNSIMNIHDSVMDIHNSIMDIHISIIDVHNKSWISIFMGFMRFWLSMRIDPVIMDIHNWILDIHNWIMDIHNYRVYALLDFHGKPKAHKHYKYGYP